MICYLNEYNSSGFVNDILEYLDRFNLNSLWSVLIEDGIDHIAIKARDTDDYLRMLTNFRPLVESMWEVDLNNRRISTARTKGNCLICLYGLSLDFFGQTRWLEIMEPRPEPIGKVVVGIDHLEVTYPRIDEMKALLVARGIKLIEGGNSFHHTIELKISDKGQEIKITDRPLSDVLREQIKSGVARSLIS